MNDLVFLEPNRLDAIPFTTSGIIAEVTEIRHDKIKASILKQKTALETFGKLTSYGVGLGGRGNESGYHLNEQQATLLITFLKNTPQVIAFKTELVRQFYHMRQELMNYREFREQLKPIRRDMTDVIQEMDAGNTWAYKQYTDLAYKAATGKIAKKLREERGANKSANAIDYMTADEIQSVAKKQSQIAVLREMGLNYDEIKALITQKNMQVLK